MMSSACAAIWRPRPCSRGCASTATVTLSMSAPGRDASMAMAFSEIRDIRETTSAR